MEGIIFPPSPSWFLPNLIASREDGSVTYASKNNIVVLKSLETKNCKFIIIPNAHTSRITAVACNPSGCHESMQNTVASCSDDGFVKLWKIEVASVLLGHKSHWEVAGEIGKVNTLDWSTANPHIIVSAAENNTLVVWNILSNSTVKFRFQKLGAAVISCCPYNDKIVAAGSKSGQVFVINLTGSGEVIYKLRGHDTKIHSLAWCPVPCNVFNDPNFNEECLLASVCLEREMFIWRCGTDGNCQFKYHLPKCPLFLSEEYKSKSGGSLNFSILCWPEPYKIYSSTCVGEVFYFDIKAYITEKYSKVKSTKKKNLIYFKLAHNIHNTGLSGMCFAPLKGEFVLLKMTETKCKLKFQIESNNCITWRNVDNECDNHGEWKVDTQENTLLWSVGQDRSLIACEVSSGQYKIIHNYHTVNGFVYCAAAAPYDPNKIAIGAGDGMVRLWNLTEPPSRVQMLRQRVKDRVMSVAWHPLKDFVFAFCTSEGRVGLINTYTNKSQVFKPNRPLPVYSLSWGPPFHVEYPTGVLFALYAVGDNILWFCDPAIIDEDVVNLSRLIPFPCKKQTDVCWKPDYSLMAVGSLDGSISLVEPKEFKIVFNVLAYKKLVQSIAWHPSSSSVDTGLSPYHGYFTSGSTDNDCEIRVFDCTQENGETRVVKVATLKGHSGHIQSVSWSPHMSAQLVSTSADGSVQIWDVITQCPLVNFTPIGMPVFSIWSPIDSDFILTGCRSDVLCTWKISAQTNVLPPPKTKTKKNKKFKGIVMSSVNESASVEETAERMHDILFEDLGVEEPKVTFRGTKEPKMFSKVWKVESRDELGHCYSLLKNDGSQTCRYSFVFFPEKDSLREFIEVEEEAHKKNNNWTEYYQLSLWTGNLKNVLDERIRSGQLNDFLVSIAPTVSPRMWQQACLSYSKTLAEKKLYRKAASYLLVCHKIYEAIRLLLDAKLFVEAFCIARSRFPESDSIGKEIIKEYAEWLFRNGSYLKACECYIFLKDYLEVAKICGKKSKAEFLSLAALAARKCNSLELEQLESANAIFKCFETNDFELARRICADHDNLQYLSLMFNVYQIIHLLDSGYMFLKTDILSHLRELCEVSEISFPISFQHLYHKYTFYKNRRQVLIIIAQELSFALCSKDKEDLITHIIKALSTSNRYLPNKSDEASLLYNLCAWLSPKGLSPDSVFTLKDDSLKLKVRSLRAFFCAAMVRKINDLSSTEDIINNLGLLKETKEDILDENGYRYFKNLIEVEVLEKKLSSNCRKAKSESIDGKNGKSSVDEESSSNGSEAKEGSEEVSVDSEIYVSTETEENTSGGSVENIEELVDEDEIVEEQALKDLETLQKLKMEIKSFESSSVSWPNPVPVYFMMKKLCEKLSENYSAKCLLEYLEKKWHLLN